MQMIYLFQMRLPKKNSKNYNIILFFDALARMSAAREDKNRQR